MTLDTMALRESVRSYLAELPNHEAAMDALEAEGYNNVHRWTDFPEVFTWREDS